jgi:hypothetical protein
VQVVEEARPVERLLQQLVYNQQAALGRHGLPATGQDDRTLLVRPVVQHGFQDQQVGRRQALEEAPGDHCDPVAQAAQHLIRRDAWHVEQDAAQVGMGLQDALEEGARAAAHVAHGAEGRKVVGRGQGRVGHQRVGGLCLLEGDAQLRVLLQIVEEGHAHHVGEGASASGQGVGKVLPGALVGVAANHHDVGVQAARGVLEHHPSQVGQAVAVALAGGDPQGGHHAQGAEERVAVQAARAGDLIYRAGAGGHLLEHAGLDQAVAEQQGCPALHPLEKAGLEWDGGWVDGVIMGLFCAHGILLRE